ncbi:MAG TPA: DNA polymerase III subunit gamma/tau [Candidatus Polarisedimenticolia bacterium]|nr:DNA polymerase III subunit gamma/tau [Candidatus Polarisedimenticolia bacterium]
MSYQVLARKYRPQTFEEVVGQKPIVTTLQNAVAQNRIHHAYLFSGLRGVGKTTVARLMAKALNCAQGPTPRPCNACPSCAEIAASRSLDVLEIDGASNRGIDAVRELRETVRYAPARDRYKVYIIDEVHMLTTEAWNALLKTLEEPPPQVVFLFATTDYRKIPLTILSRCQHFEFKKIPQEEMLAHLATVAQGENISIPAGVLDLIARMAEGSLRDAQSALDQVIAFSGPTVTDEQARTILGVIDRDLITGFYAAVRGGDCERLVAMVETVFDRGYQPVQFLEDLMAYGRDLLLARVVSDPAKYLTGDAAEIRAIAGRAAEFSEDELLRLLEILTREEYRLKTASHPRFLLEALAIKLARLADLRPIEELIARLEEGPEGPAPGPGPARRAGAPPPAAPPRDRVESRPAAPSPVVTPARTEPAPAPISIGTGPAPAPTTASPAAPPSPARQEQAVIEAILKRVHDERGALGGFLGQASWLEITEDALEIAFAEKQGFFREKVESREALEYLRGVARQIAGRELKIRIAVASPAALDTRTVSAAEAEESRKRRLREEAMRQPVMQTLLDAFGGEIIDVETT